MTTASRFVAATLVAAARSYSHFCGFRCDHCKHLFVSKKVKVAHSSITKRRVPELIPVLGSQPAGDVSHKPGGRLPLLSRSYPRNPGCYQFRCLVNRGTMGVNGLLPYPTVSRLRFEPRPYAPESSTLTTRLPSHLSSADWSNISKCLIEGVLGYMVCCRSPRGQEISIDIGGCQAARPTAARRSAADASSVTFTAAVEG